MSKATPAAPPPPSTQADPRPAVRLDLPEPPLPIGPAARHLRLPVSWLKAEADAGRLPCVRAGRRLLFNVAAVAALLAERATRPDPAADVQRAALPAEDGHDGRPSRSTRNAAPAGPSPRNAKGGADHA